MRTEWKGGECLKVGRVCVCVRSRAQDDTLGRWTRGASGPRLDQAPLCRHLLPVFNHSSSFPLAGSASSFSPSPPEDVPCCHPSSSCLCRYFSPVSLPGLKRRSFILAACCSPAGGGIGSRDWTGSPGVSWRDAALVGQPSETCHSPGAFSALVRPLVA